MSEHDNALWTLLRQAQVDHFKFKRQAPIGRYVADFVCPAARLVVEMDATAQGGTRDPAREAWFVQQGFRVLHVRRGDVQRDARGVLQRVQEALLQAAPAAKAAVPVPTVPVSASNEDVAADVVAVDAVAEVAAVGETQQPAAVDEAAVDPVVVSKPLTAPEPDSAPKPSPVAKSAPAPAESPWAKAKASVPAPSEASTSASASRPEPAAESPWSKAKVTSTTPPLPVVTDAADATDDDESPWVRARRVREERGDVVRAPRSEPKASEPFVREPDAREPVAPQQKPASAQSAPAPAPAPAPATSQQPVPAARRTDTVEIRMHGLNACLAAFAARPQDLRKVYLLQSRLGVLRDVLAWCVSHRLGYRVVEEADLAKLAGSTHHEGVAFDLLVRPQPTLAELLATLPPTPQRLLWLDGVGNPHNFGAVLRAAAHFGAAAVLLPPDSTLTLSGAAARVAEGGAEALAVVKLDDTAAAVEALHAAGFSLAATLPRDASSLYAGALPARCVFVLGAERHGMQQALIASCDMRVNIPGTGKVESLNIANAVGVLLAEHWRQHAE